VGDGQREVGEGAPRYVGVTRRDTAAKRSSLRNGSNRGSTLRARNSKQRSSHALTSQRVSALSAGCDEVISKPFDLAKLGETVDRIVNVDATPLKRKRKLA